MTHKNLYITGIVFHNAGTFSLNKDITVTVDNPSMVLINRITGIISVSDPSTKLPFLNITVKDGYPGNTSTRPVNLPTDPYAGTSVRLEGMIQKMKSDKQ